jgi:glycerate kinase
MTQSMPVLVAPDALSAALRAPVVAAAIGRGLERAGLGVPDLCPVAGGGPGTLEVLLPALGGETAGARVRDASGREVVAAFGLVDGGGTAIVEAAQVAGASSSAASELVAGASPSAAGELVTGASSAAVGELIAAAITAGAEVVVIACGGSGARDCAAGAAEAVERAGGLRGASLVALHDDDGLARGLADRLGAQLVPGAGFVLEELGFDARMRAARAVVVGEALLDRGSLAGRVAGEIAIRARQSGIPCHAVVGRNAIDRFDARILDVQAIIEATTIAELEDAGGLLAQFL